MIRFDRRFARRDLLRALPAIAMLLPALYAQGQSPASWHPAPSPLKTRWAADVSPTNARPEYPRPLMVRKDWKNLNGLWQFAFDDENRGRDSGWQTGHPLPTQILVPWTFEASLSGIGRGKEVHEHVWYRRNFDVPAAWRGKRILLHFGAVDWESTIWVNGTKQGVHRGGYTPFEYDITDSLKPRGPQEVVVAVYDPADPKRTGWQPKGKQLGSDGIFYTRTTGIWQTVWIEPVNARHIEVVALEPKLSRGIVDAVVGAPRGGPYDVQVVISQSGRIVSSFRFPQSAIGGIRVPHPLLWTCETPYLYDATVRLYTRGRLLDEVQSYFAFRTAGIAKGRLTLNGKPYYYRGVLDQGFWPDGIYTPPTDAAIRNDVLMIKKMGLNMARKHVKVEDPRWYYWCDKLGVAVWQDMPSSHNLSRAEAKSDFRYEWQDVVSATRGHPCIVQWIPFNENWGDPKEFQDDIVRMTHEIDPTRPVTDASGWKQHGLTDVIDAHNYSNDLLKEGVPNPVKPKVVGEFGGIALPVAGHTWTTGWGYQSVRTPEDLVQRIRMQTTQLFEAQSLSGFVYTQLTDVEQELNGLMTYDRIPKAEPAELAADFTGAVRAARPSYIRNWLVLGPIPAGFILPSAEDNSANRSLMREMLGRSYLPAESELKPVGGQIETVGGERFIWTTEQLNSDALDFIKLFGGPRTNAVAYAVAYVDSPREVRNVTLFLGSDDGCVVWLNGQKIHSVDRIRGIILDEDAVPGLTLKQGRNVLVVKVGQGMGAWGLIARFEIPGAK